MNTTLTLSKRASHSAVNAEFVITRGKRKARMRGDFIAGTRVIRNVRPVERRKAKR